MSDTPTTPPWRLSTQLVRAGRAPDKHQGGVNPPVQRFSTVLKPTVEELYADHGRTYGLDGSDVHAAVLNAQRAIEGGDGGVLVPSGLAACTVALISATAAGGDVLCTDSVYGPTRRFLDHVLARYGVATRYFDPGLSGEALAALIAPNTQALMLESPGSLTFEMQDVPALTAAAKARGVTVILDNTWSAGLHFKPFAHGVDLSVQALTKYQGGHADALLGAVLAGTPAWTEKLQKLVKQLGIGPGAPEDAALVLRGMRTMTLRMKAQAEASLQIAAWLQARPEVAAVLHPALPDAPGHDLWRRDFTGACGVFAIVLNAVSRARVTAMMESYRLFAMGFSWGGYESLAIPCDQQTTRTAGSWKDKGPLIRYSIGLEDPADLIADLEQGFAVLKG
jgi:cystathionine beta-lyase